MSYDRGPILAFVKKNHKKMTNVAMAESFDVPIHRVNAAKKKLKLVKTYEPRAFDPQKCPMYRRIVAEALNGMTSLMLLRKPW